MNLKLTKKQYKNLLKLVYLGNWLINAIRLEDDRIKKYDEIEEYIYSFAKKAGLEKYIEFDKKFNKFFPTREFSDGMYQYIEEYDDDAFWEELIDRLARCDFVKKYGQKTIRKMDLKELIEKEQPFLDKYAKEFAKHGLKNLEINPKIKRIFGILKGRG